MDDALVLAIRERYELVLGKIAEATKQSGRDNGTVQVVVVSKSQPLNVVRAAIAAGVSILGENYAEEAIAKISALTEARVEWHMIGHVQSRKVNLVVGHFSMMHSLDSVNLAERLNRICDEEGQALPILLEINVSGEKSKFGFPGWDEGRWQDLEPVFRDIMKYPHLRLCGLMAMPPLFDIPEHARPYFKRLRKLQEYLKERIPQADWTELSMGTSMDFTIAVEEGATYVRVGEAILGPRPQ